MRWTLCGGVPRPKSQRMAWDPDFLTAWGKKPAHPVVLRSVRAVWRATQAAKDRQ